MPMTPNGVVVKPGTNFANISWFPVSLATAYAMEMDGKVYSPINTNSITVSNLQPNSRHTVQVSAYGEGVWSSYSKPVYFTL